VRPGRGRDDRWVARARRFQEVLARCDGDLQHPRLDRLDPAVAGACRARSGGDGRRRWEVEARIVADRPTAEVAGRTGLPAGVVEAYEALFFAVRDRLGCIDWIATFVFGPRLYEGITEKDADLILKRFAYGYGAVVLDALIPVLFSCSAKGAGGGEADIDHRLAASLHRAVATLTIPVTAKTAPMLIQLDLRRREVEREAEAAGVAAVSGPIPMIPPGFAAPVGHVAADEDLPLAVAGLTPEDWRGAVDVDGPELDLVGPTALVFPRPDLDRLLVGVRLTA
jgi:hypothetical protein